MNRLNRGLAELAELAEVTTLLSVSRLVTLTWFGGVGKTRLANLTNQRRTPAAPEIEALDARKPL